MCHVSGQCFTCVLVFYLPDPSIYYHTNVVANRPPSHTTHSFSIGFSLCVDLILNFASQLFPTRRLLFNSFKKTKQKKKVRDCPYLQMLLQLKNLALEAETELERQDEVLDVLTSSTDRTTMQIGKHTCRMKRLL